MNQLNYFPIIKLKDSELRFLDYLKEDFRQDDIVPYFEFIKEPDGPQDKRKRKKPLTLNAIQKVESSLPSGKEYIAEIYHFDNKIRNDCDKPFIIQNKDPKIYFDSMVLLARFGHCIPSFLIQNDGSLDDALRFVGIVHEMGKKCAIRSTTFDGDIIENVFRVLGPNDYFFLDIRTNRIAASKPAFTDVFDCRPLCHVVLTYSSRSDSNATLKSFHNDTYESKKITPDQFEAVRDIGFPFYGFADYCGQKDDVNTGGNGKSYVKTGFIYSFKKKGFLILQDQSGANNLNNVKTTMLGKRAELDPLNVCPAYKLVIEKCKNEMGFWWMVCLVRYVNQINQEING
jgi:hypothetical protein